jgi:RNA polymerase subunit RPABC4/transcription elongation factor Spt4
MIKEMKCRECGTVIEPDSENNKVCYMCLSEEMQDTVCDICGQVLIDEFCPYCDA